MALDTVAQDARRFDEELSQCEQEERLKRQRAQGFCRRTVEMLDSRAQNALAHSAALANSVMGRLVPAQAESAQSDDRRYGRSRKPSGRWRACRLSCTEA